MLHKIPPCTLGAVLTSVAALVIEGLAPFEFGVVCEVFGIDRTDDGVPPFDFRVCAEHPGEPVRTSVGVPLTPDRPLTDLVTADLVAVPACTIREQYPAVVVEPGIVTRLLRQIDGVPDGSVVTPPACAPP